jgi:hypothetical protein
VESCCEFGIEPTGSMKCWETIEWLTSSGHWISVQLHIVSWLVSLPNIRSYMRTPPHGIVNNYSVI